MSVPVVALAKGEKHADIVKEWLVKHVANELCTHLSPLGDHELIARANLLAPSKPLVVAR